jgi:hypothetical protein
MLYLLINCSFKGRRAAGGRVSVAGAHIGAAGSSVNKLNVTKERVMKKSIGFLSAVVLSVSVVGCSDSMSPAAPSELSSTEALPPAARRPLDESLLSR